LLLETRQDALTVPSSAIQRGPQGLFVWVVNDDSTVAPRKVELGPAISGNETLINAGLSVNDRVVTEGQYKLDGGAAVTPTRPTAPTLAGGRTCTSPSPSSSGRSQPR